MYSIEHKLTALAHRCPQIGCKKYFFSIGEMGGPTGDAARGSCLKAPEACFPGSSGLCASFAIGFAPHFHLAPPPGDVAKEKKLQGPHPGSPACPKRVANRCSPPIWASSAHGAAFQIALPDGANLGPGLHYFMCRVRF